MKLNPKKPSEILNTTYKNKPLTRDQIELFKKELQNLFHKIDDKKKEDYHKTEIIKFLDAVYYKDKYQVNLHEMQDLAIHSGNSSKDDVAVILEFKRPSEKYDMVSATNANVKALQELILYYLRETVDKQNHKITNLVVTNIYEWFIFDGVWFEKNIFRNTKLIKEYLVYKNSGHDTKYFYNNVAAQFLNQFSDDVPCTYFNLLDFKKIIEDNNPNNDNDLIDLYKILSPEHLLNIKPVHDSNSLNIDFYNELLYIIGLEESKDTAKKIIRRISESERNVGSLIENTISVLKTNKFLGYDKSDDIENQYYEIALELSITWLNRILFLKLLESQLIKYHRGDSENYAFLTSNKIKDFDELHELFFDVLAEKTDERKPEVIKKYQNIPYLNSSLFELTDLEKNALKISNLKDRLEFPVYKKSVLKKGTKETIKPKTSLNYLLDFLDAYNFASENNAKIQEQEKTIINASVLGLIFEKINGYKDGSFFTPGFITMYMCRETIRKAVVEKFKTNFDNCQDITEFDDLRDRIDYKNKTQRLAANKLINEIRIVDPAVGSGHFLVSALNEMIAIKSDLRILSYHNNARVTGYTILLENDELNIENQETNKQFLYTLNQNNNIIPDLQDLQECLFKEKQTIIENCLFGVDINPKSVMICQLRLWIELLKNAYYTKESDFKELHTLPNIDINIKTGNSLISKFATKDNVLERIPKYEQKLKDYKDWVFMYKETNDKAAKDVFKKQIKAFKDEFELLDPRIKEIEKKITQKSTDILLKYNSGFSFGTALTDKQMLDKQKLDDELKILLKTKNEIQDNPIYANAFEWRFEFPEVLNDKGDFIGFDVVIGNPPYGVALSSFERAEIGKVLGKVPDFEIYYFFINLSKNLLTTNGLNSYIIPNTILFNVYAKNYRETLFDNWQINSILDCTNFTIFDGATVRCIITEFMNKVSVDHICYKPTAKITSFNELIATKTETVTKTQLLENNQNWGLVFKLDKSIIDIVLKLKKHKKLTNDFDCTQGYIPYRKSDLIKVYGTDKANKIVKYREWHSNIKENEDYKKEIWGSDFTKFRYSDSNSFVFYGKHLATYVDLKYFNQKRLLVREITSPNIIGCIVIEELVNDPQLIAIIPKSHLMTIEILWSLINSKLATFYHFNSSPKATKGAFPKILIEDIKNFPLPKISKSIQEKLTIIVDKILALKKQNPKTDTSILENEIDDLVYRLYDLTPEEIKIVQSS